MLANSGHAGLSINIYLAVFLWRMVKLLTENLSIHLDIPRYGRQSHPIYYLPPTGQHLPSASNTVEEEILLQIF